MWNSMLYDSKDYNVEVNYTYLPNEKNMYEEVTHFEYKNGMMVVKKQKKLKQIKKTLIQECPWEYYNILKDIDSEYWYYKKMYSFKFERF